MQSQKHVEHVGLMSARHSATASTINFFACPDPKWVESFLKDTIETIQDGDQICYSCYKFINQILNSDVCMLCSEDILSELKAKQEHLERVVYEFKCTTPNSYVELGLYETALHSCKLVASDQAFLFSTIYPIWDPHLGRRLDLFIVDESYLRIGQVKVWMLCVHQTWVDLKTS